MRIASVNSLGLTNYAKQNAVKQRKSLETIKSSNNQEISFKNQQLKSTGTKLAKSAIGGLAGLGLCVLTGGLGTLAIVALPGLGAIAGAIKGDSDDRKNHPENYEDDDTYENIDYGSWV